jgi:hypothetical protein
MTLTVELNSQATGKLHHGPCQIKQPIRAHTQATRVFVVADTTLNQQKRVLSRRSSEAFMKLGKDRDLDLG